MEGPRLLMSPFLLSDIPGDVAVWIGGGASVVYAGLTAINVKLISNLIAMADSRNREAQLLIEKTVLMEHNKELEAEISRRDSRIVVLVTEGDRLRVERDEARRANEARGVG